MKTREEKSAALAENKNLKKQNENLSISKSELEEENEKHLSEKRFFEREAKRIERDNKALELEKKRLQEAKLNAISEKTAAMEGVSALTREIEWLRKQTDIEQAGIMKLVRDRDMMKKNLAKIEEVNKKNMGELLQRD